MADYTALIAKWATLTPGTTEQKLAQINALTIADPAGAKKAILNPSAILNAVVPADLASLTTAQVTLLTLILQGNQMDASVGTTIRAAAVSIFAGKTQTLANLGALVAPFDSPTVLWWSASVANGGGGLTSQVGPADLAAAGGLV